ncbi:MAG: hypothetical protein U5K31_13380 [Balneolaceae bacterium]|nr:hypothetical protein [Balneolaceae bacterium]
MKKLLSGLISLLACLFFIDSFGGDLNTLERAGRMVLLIFYVTSGLLIMQIRFQSDDFKQELILTAGCMGGMFLLFGVSFIPFPLHAALWAFTTLALFNFVRDRCPAGDSMNDVPRAHAPREIDIRA